MSTVENQILMFIFLSVSSLLAQPDTRKPHLTTRHSLTNARLKINSGDNGGSTAMKRRGANCSGISASTITELGEDYNGAQGLK
jgi:hypothetical protein